MQMATRNDGNHDRLDLTFYYHRGIRPKPPRVEAVSGMLPPDPEAIATANF